MSKILFSTAGKPVYFVSFADSQERSQWATHFGVSVQRLMDAIRAVGNCSDFIEEYLAAQQDS